MASVTQTAIASSSTDTATPTFAAQAIGANGGSDVLYISAGARTIANASTMACSVDGVAATQAVFFSQNDGGNVRSNVGIFVLPRNNLPDPNQTDVDIVLTHDQVCIRHAVAVAVSPDASSSAFATKTAALGVSDVSVNTSADGIVVGSSYDGNGNTVIWTGLTEVSDIDVAAEGSNRFSTAYASAVSAETPRTITATLLNDAAAKVVASFSTASVVGVDAAQAAVAGQTIDLFEDPIPVTAAAAAVAGQTIDIINLQIAVDPVDVAVQGQAVTLVGGGATLNLASSIYAALADDLYITSRLGQFMSPSIHTRRPVPEGAEYPMIVVNPDTSIINEDALVSRRPVITRDVIAYGEQDGQYRVVEELGYYLRDKFHRNPDSLTVSGYDIIDIVVVGPFPAPTDDYQHIARGVTLTIRLQTA